MTFMKDAMNVFYGMVLSPLIAMLTPMKDLMLLAVVMFLTNFIFGWLSDVVRGDGWSTKKATTFVFHCTVYFVLVCAVYIAAHFEHYPEETTQFILKCIGCGILYIFTVNILKNACIIVPRRYAMGRLFWWMYYALTAEFLKKIPYLKESLETKGDESERDIEEED